MATSNQSLPRAPGSPWTIAEVCQAARFSRVHLYRLLKDGLVTSIKMGKSKRMIPDAEVQRLLNAGIASTTNVSTSAS